MREYNERPKRDAITFNHVAPPVIQCAATAWRNTQSIKVQLAAVLKHWENVSDEDDLPHLGLTSQSLLAMIDEADSVKKWLGWALDAALEEERKET